MFLNKIETKSGGSMITSSVANTKTNILATPFLEKYIQITVVKVFTKNLKLSFNDQLICFFHCTYWKELYLYFIYLLDLFKKTTQLRTTITFLLRNAEGFLPKVAKTEPLFIEAPQNLSLKT